MVVESGYNNDININTFFADNGLQLYHTIEETREHQKTPLHQ